MIPELIDENTFLLRDYTSLIQNLTEKLPNLTDRWTDLSVSEPDTIFLSNIAYVNDLTSYAIDYRYLLTSVKHTASWDFMDSVCILTGSSAPFYRESYSLAIKNTGYKSKLIHKNTVLYDSTHTYAVTTLQDVFILPRSESSVSVILGNAYNQSLGKKRYCQVRSKEPMNRDTLFDLETGKPLDISLSSAETMFRFLLDAKEMYWTAQGDRSSLLFSPSLPYLPYRFVGFSLEKENVLADGASIILPKFEGSISLRRESEGTKPRGLNDTKVSYLESLQKIQVDLNPLLYEERFRDGRYEDVKRTSLSFVNNRNSVISKSYVSYTEGYIDLGGNFSAGDKVSVAYDCYSDTTGPSVLVHRAIGYEFPAKAYSTTINLELDEGYTVKAYSIVLCLSLADGTEIYCTDYNNELIIPRGREVYREYKYLLSDGRSCTDLDFAFGECHEILEIHVSDSMVARERITQGDNVTDDRTVYLRDSLAVRESNEIYDGHGTVYETPAETSGTYYRNPVGLIIPLQMASAVTVQDVLYPLNPLRFGIQVYLDGVDRRKVLKIRDRDGKPLFKVVFRSIEGQESRYPILLDEEAIQEQTAMPSCVWHNNVGIYIIPSELMDIGKPVTVTLDGICTYQYNSLAESDRVRTGQGLSPAYFLPYDAEFMQEFYPRGTGFPKTVCITVGDRKYVSETGSNFSSENFYNSMASADLTKHTIDLYQIEPVYSQVTEVTVDIKAKVYLKPLDLSNQFIEDGIRASLEGYFRDLEIGKEVRTASILSKIVHSSEYIAYAEIILPTDDIFIEDTQLAVMGDISITFRNPDIIQY